MKFLYALFVAQMDSGDVMLWVPHFFGWRLSMHLGQGIYFMDLPAANYIKYFSTMNT